MLKRGLRGRGFSVDNLLLGGGTDDVTITTPSCIYGVSGYTNIDSVPHDLVVRSLTVNNQFTPTNYVSTGNYYCLYKLQVREKLNINGSIRCDGSIPGGGGSWSDNAGSPAYMGPFQYNSGVYINTVGGSGLGGSSNPSGAGSAGMPNGSIPNAPLTYFGGAGGSGLSSGGQLGGTGGFNVLNSITVPGVSVINWFSPSVYQEGIIYSNLDGNTGSYPANGYFLKPYKINGGGGGGGNGGSGGGGAAGGGVCHILCDTLVLGTTGASINANGGSGLGGGGGGGVVIIVASEIQWGASATITVQGGHGGDVGGANNGSHGRVLIFSNNLVASFDTYTTVGFDGIVTKAMYDAAVLAYNS